MRKEKNCSERNLRANKGNFARGVESDFYGLPRVRLFNLKVQLEELASGFFAGSSVFKNREQGRLESVY